MEISSKIIGNKLHFSRQQLYYFRKVGFFSASERTAGGHYRYTFKDLKVLKIIRLLQLSGISLYQIKKVFSQLKKNFPDAVNPFLETPILVFDKKVVYVKAGRAYDALTGQSYLLDVKKIEKWAGEVIEMGAKSISLEYLEEYYTQIVI